jgi:competence ComEA-like helix-hairpin-helix protein
MWKDFFYFTKTERQGIIVLVVLILGVFSIPQLFSLFNHPQKVDAAEQEKFEKELNEFISSLEEIKPHRKPNDSSFRSSSKREIRLTAFDPNTADSMTFLSLGLPSWMAKNILHYRSKQGRFHHPEDFRKIYGLTEEQYQTLLPYIQIAKSSEPREPRDTVQLLTAQNIQRDTIFKYQPGTIISLNSADTTELKKIPGIGSAIARKIVNYRKRLGAFCRIEQLKEIQLKAEKLRPWFSIDAGQIHRINLNKASLERMTYHPYINFYQAKVIVEYRKKKGNIKSLKQLLLYEEFTPADFERLEPYVCCDL